MLIIDKNTLPQIICNTSINKLHSITKHIRDMSRQLLIPVKDLKTNENIDGLNNTIYAVKVVEVLKKRRKKV
jgi:hypothetical protein